MVYVADMILSARQNLIALKFSLSTMQVFCFPKKGKYIYIYIKRERERERKAAVGKQLQQIKTHMRKYSSKSLPCKSSSSSTSRPFS